MLSAERSLMSWVRTSLSMIGFGFSIYAFLQSLMQKGISFTMTPEGPRRIGIFLLALGVCSILFGSVEYIHIARQIYKLHKVTIDIFSLIISLLVFLLGLLLLSAIIIKINFI